jgi:hypothetical protein
MRPLLRSLERQLNPVGLVRLALLFNAPFVILRAQRLAYDSYSHIFFADHYRRNWWSLWEPRWYLGFSTASYPPLVHRLIALLSWPLEFIIAAFAPAPEAYPGALRWLGEEAAYVMVQLAVLAAFPLAVRAFARAFAPERTANWAALLAIGLPALSLAAWSFGQLPTLAATTSLLFALARGAHFLRTGDKRALLHAVLLAATAAATHHAAFLFVPFAALALTFQVSAFTRATDRILVWAALSALAVALVLWPFLQWSAGQALQTPIDHASRYNFIERPEATLFFFWPMYGPLLLALPLLFKRRWWGLALAAGPLFVLNLGGTTPLPRLLFGAGWEWLTYDRFGLWAALCLLLPAGATLTGLRRRPRRAVFLIGAVAACGLASGCLALIARTQPPAVNLTPIVQFLNTQAQYRYLALGFGDQFAKLSALTSNGTLDGNYHTARALPELRASGLGALDGAVWNPRGVWAAAPILREPGRYGLRWAFVNHKDYAPVLRAAGWAYRFEVGTVQAWERDDVLPVRVAPPAEDRVAALWWGLVPLAVLGASLAPLATRVARANLRAVRRAGLALTVILLALWWAAAPRTGADDLPHIYFTYRSVLIYASDVALTLTLALWLIERLIRRAPLRPTPLLLLPGVVALSSLNASDRSLTLAFGLHLALLVGLFGMMRDEPPEASWIGWLFGGVIAAQCGLALAQALAQNTFMLHDLYLRWPGDLDAALRGASVSASATGERWLRAYGSWPHPNVLGAMLLAMAGAAWERWLATGRRWWLALLVLVAVTLVLTISRATWLGALAGSVGLIGLLPRDSRGRLRSALALGAVAAALTAAWLWPYILPRADVSPSANELERASMLERSLLIGYGLEAFRAQPLTGVGAAGFVQWAARTLPERYPFEPVHSAPLLILAETGLPGGAVLVVAVFAFTRRVWRRRAVMGITEAVWSATLLGLLVSAPFDHLWWSQAPARTLLAMVLALWANSSLSPGAPGSQRAD